jgi:hypothetical protein
METEMNKTLSTILTVLTIIVLAGVIFFAGMLYARANMMWGWSNENGYGRGMMGQGGMTLAPGASAGVNGMMNGNGGMMGGMMNGYGYTNSGLAPLTIDEAKAAAEKYLSNLENSDFTIGEVMIFNNHAYLVIKEESTDVGAFELLVDPASKTAYPEHGPNMMWNLKYSGLNHQYMMENNGGMMGMMGGSGMMSGNGWSSTNPADVSAEMTVMPEQAMEYAQKYLDENVSGTLATSPIQFYGYYTLHFENDGEVAGMLSVHGFSGQVFLHTWHGTFIEKAQ